jgi:tRNA threonylcarbamoyl adenosine modification protein YeaZ
MIILGLDTTGSQCSVSLVDEARVLAHICRDIGRGHAEVLAGMVEEALTKAAVTPADIDRIAVCTGPGNFTGLRVALSFAKGFALPRNLPVIGIDALALTASRLDPTASQKIAVQQDVRRGEYFYAFYEKGKVQFPPRAMTKEALELRAAEKGVDKIHETEIDTRILAWLSIDYDPADYPAEPLYARAPDAKLPGGKSLPKIETPKTKAPKPEV